jgi:nucleoside-diphosphate-sugar epimerase
MVLVYGAAGLLGHEICHRLRNEGKRVRALLPRSTSQASLEALKRLDVEMFMADLNELPAVAAACSGEQAVICADPAMMPCRNGPPLEASGVRCLIEFASRLCVHKFVFVTVPEQFSTPCALVSAHAEGRARLESHRMDYVILETGFFMETWLSPELEFDYREGKAVVYGEGTQPVAWVSYDDVAELAVRSLSMDHRRKHRIRVATPEQMSPFDLIRVFEEMQGGHIEAARIAESDLRAQHKRAADPADRVHAAMKVEYARGTTLRADYDEIPIALASVRDYARRVTGSRVASE